MRPKLKDLKRPKIFQSPAAAAAAASVTAAYALSITEKLDFATAKSNSNGAEKSLSEQDVAVEVEAIREEKTLLEQSLTEVRTENSKLSGKIEEINGTHSELSKVCRSFELNYLQSWTPASELYFHLLNHFLPGTPISPGAIGS